MNSVSPSRWRQIQDVLDAALELPAAQALAFVERTCAGDDELRRAVERLLHACGRAQKFLEDPAVNLAASLIASIPDPLPMGAHIGPYRIIREAGRGGMGAVYLAERADEAFQKRVAIKLVKHGMDTEEVLRRFRYERQILASLEHPNIARLHDGGVSDDGRPYLVMEYIEGQPITVDCDTRRLTVDERLARFETVCEAVQYAHQNLVVHRDLKPSNILVTADGTVKLLDFGIAKLLAEDAADAAPRTRTGVRVLTPEYASPEQLRELPVTTASDVYALGVLLYELLTGRRPHAGAAARGLEVERAVLEQEPERPSVIVTRVAERHEAHGESASLSPEAIAASRGTSADRLRRSLTGDLDRIVLKALAKEPERRYQSAQQLLDDLRRHRQGLPVLAQTATLSYRAAKFARRHRPGVLAALLVVLSLLGGLGAALWQAGRAARERDIAQQERDTAQQVGRFLEELFQAPDPFAEEAEGADTLRVRDFLARGAAKVQRELRGQPAVQARMLDVLGRVYESLGIYDRAQPLLEQALRLRQGLYGAEHPEVAETQHKLALVLRDRGDLARAELLFRLSLAQRRRLYGDHHADVAESLNGLAAVLQERGQYEEAVQRHQEALAILRKTVGDRDPKTLVVLHDLVTTLDEKPDPESAERYARTALTLSRSLYGNRHPRVALALNDLALPLQRKGQYAAAESLTRQSLAIGEQTLGPEHPRVAEILNRLASLLYWQGDLISAESLHYRALAIKRKHFGRAHLQVAEGMHNLAQVLRAKGELDSAEALNRGALAMIRDIGGDEHPFVAIVTSSLAITLQAKGDCRQALPLYREAIAGIARTLSPGHWRIPRLQRHVGACLTALGRYAEAESMLLESYRVLRQTRGESDSFAREALERLVALYTTWGKQEKVAEYQALLASASAVDR